MVSCCKLSGFLPGRKEIVWYNCRMQIKIIRHTSFCLHSQLKNVGFPLHLASFVSSKFKDKTWTNFSGTFACVWDAEQSPLLVSTEGN